jgi:hypothetical protein
LPGQFDKVQVSLKLLIRRFVDEPWTGGYYNKWQGDAEAAGGVSPIEKDDDVAAREVAPAIKMRERLPIQTPKKKKPQQGAGGALGLGLPIFETKTHPVTASTTTDRELGSCGWSQQWM